MLSVGLEQANFDIQPKAKADSAKLVEKNGEPKNRFDITSQDCGGSLAAFCRSSV
jgi:hypothetical protein